MTIKQLINQLNNLIESNPKYSDIEVRWYDDLIGRISHGDGWPIQLFENIYTKEICCVLNSIHNPPAFGLKPISNKKNMC